ncbi:MAG TPA: Npt1/Npt2 family nucleotide transporter, partial [Acidobacteriota bacterium]|nr:Npt1/Npt2 family nucleotide transporter [Acidobacteriota bacterium]
MSPLLALARWLDIRPDEYRTFTVSALGAFLVMSFSVTARSLREAFFIDEFSVESLPYVIIVTAIVSLPSVGAFSRLMGRHNPESVYRMLVSLLIGGLGVFWILASLFWASPAERDPSAGAFYVFTALGTLLLTSGFWVVTSERFALRDAKRLFGMIAAGGTLGAMLAGISLGPLGRVIGNGGLVVSLIATLGALLLLLRLLPQPEAAPPTRNVEDAAIGESLALVASNPHLRNMAMIIAVATVASGMIDYQFKEAAAAVYTDDADLAAFLGTFYGISGVAALAIQMLVASRLLSIAGIGISLAVLPIVLLTGSAALFFLPGLITATLVRGADNTLRKSTHRSVLEYLYVPVPAGQRRRTKTFIDSFVDSAAEGIAAVVVFAWVVFAGLPSRGLSAFVAVSAVAFLFLARTMGKEYFRTLLDRLKEGQEAIEDSLVQTQFAGGEMTMTVTQFDLKAALTQTGLTMPTPASATHETATNPAQTTATTLEQLTDSDPTVVSAALDTADDWRTEHIEPLTRLLARDAFYRRAGRILHGLGEEIIEPLAALLLDPKADFIIRRRIPRVLASVDLARADDALLDGLAGDRFEVRYRSGVALARRRKKQHATAKHNGAERIWSAVRAEVGRDRPIWELQRLLGTQPDQDDFVSDRVYGRGELSLEHTFRLLSQVLDPEPIRTAFHEIG